MDRFRTDFRYTERVEKAEYVFKKYEPILSGRILDIGSDECHLRNYLAKPDDYVGVGLGGNPDISVNLERERLPFEDQSFDTSLCLDVLEHLDDPYKVLEDICRVTKKYAIISLPNAWNGVWNVMRRRDYRPGQPLKFYGLPPEPPEDRHKWFLSARDGERFLRHQGEKNGFSIEQVDFEVAENPASGLRKLLRGIVLGTVLRKDFDMDLLDLGNVWVVLVRKDS